MTDREAMDTLEAAATDGSATDLATLVYTLLDLTGRQAPS